jgi:hypothetical protein
MKTSNLTRANLRPRITPEKLAAYSEAAILACREAGVGSTGDLADAFGPAFAAYQTAFESTPVCPASAAFPAAVAAARRAVFGRPAIYPAPV